MSTVPQTAAARFEPLTPALLDAVLAVEQQAYAHPWNRTNFLDTLQAGYQAQVLMGDDTVLGGFYSYGEISPFSSSARCELHNQTMTVTTLTEL